MDKIISFVRRAWAALIAAPVIAPLLDLLHRRTILVLLAGFIGYVLVPQIQNLPPIWRDRLGDFVFYGTLIASGRFAIEGLMKARAGLPTSMEDYLRALLSEILSPTPDSAAIATSTAPIQWHSVPIPVSQLPSQGSLNLASVPAPRLTLPPDQQADKG